MRKKKDMGKESTMQPSSVTFSRNLKVFLFAYVMERPPMPLDDPAWIVKVATTGMIDMLSLSKADDAYTRVSAWLDGNIHGKHALSVSNLETCLKMMIGKVEGLMTKADVKHFLHLVQDERYALLYTSKKIEDVYQQENIPEGPLSLYWSTYHLDMCIPTERMLPLPYIPRDEHSKLLDSAAGAFDQRQPVVLYGPNGSGKTALLTWLSQQESVRKHFSRPGIWIEATNQSTEKDWLEILQVRLLPPDKWQRDTDAGVIWARLTAALAERAVLLILDDCQMVDVAKRLARLLPPGGLVLAAKDTASLDEAMDLDVIGVRVKPFEGQELLAYYRSRYEQAPTLETAERVLDLGKTLDQDMRAFQICLAALERRDWDWEKLFARLTELAEQSPLGMVLRVAEDTLSGDGQKALRALGGLPTLRNLDILALAALWDVPTEQVVAMAGDLAGWMVLQGDGPWELEEPVRKCAEEMLQDHPDEQTQAGKWLERLARMPEQAKRYAEYCEQLVTQPKPKEALADAYRRLPYQWGKEWRAIRLLFYPGQAAHEWAVFEKHTQIFTARQISLAYMAQREELRQNWLMAGTIWIALLMLVMSFVFRQLMTVPWSLLLAGIWGLASVEMRCILRGAARRDKLWFTLWADVLPNLDASEGE